MTILNTQAAMNVALLVDQYRHQRQAMEKYLNQHESRAELEKALTEFYQRQGITDVSPEMIKAGIEAYEKNRFTFKGVQGSWLTQKAASLYLWLFSNRWYISSITAGGVAMVAALVMGWNVIDASLNKARMAELQSQVQQATLPGVSLQGMLSEVQQMRKALIELPIDQMEHAKAHAKTTALLIEHQLVEAWEKAAQSNGASTFVIDSSAVTQEAIEAEQKRFEQYLADNDPVIESVSSKLNIAATSLESLQMLVKADLGFQFMEGRDIYQQYKQDADIIAERTGILLSLRAGKGVEAFNAVQNLNQSLASKEIHAALSESLEDLAPLWASGIKDPEGQSRMAAMIESVRRAIQSGNTEQYHAAVAKAQSLKQYIVADLAIRIVDRPGVDSGFARNNDRTKRHYVVLEAIDSNGQVFERDIENVETGAIEKAKYWGQRVDQDVFERVKADKVADGVIDNPAFGKKPSGYYEINYSTPTLNSSVTRW